MNIEFRVYLNPAEPTCVVGFPINYRFGFIIRTYKKEGFGRLRSGLAFRGVRLRAWGFGLSALYVCGTEKARPCPMYPPIFS